MVNATVTEPTAPSYLTRVARGPPRPTPSNLNYVPGQTVPNLVTVAVGADGKVSVYNNAGSTHVIFDVVGYYSEAGRQRGSRFHAVTPTALFDTRTGSGGVGTSGRRRHVQVEGHRHGRRPVDGVTGVVLERDRDPAERRRAIITVYPDDVSRPAASNLNFVPGLTVPEPRRRAGPGERRRSTSTTSRTSAVTSHLLADVVGYFDGDKSTEAGRLITVQSRRVATDTRLSSPAPRPDASPPVRPISR